MLSSTLLIFCASFAVCTMLTPFGQRAATHYGLLDRPDGRRKTHSKPIPVTGGVVVFLACCLSLALPLLVSNSFRELFTSRWNVFVSLFIAGGMLCIVGVIDDYRGLRGRHKLTAQIAATLVIVSFGLVVRGLGLFGYDFELGHLAIPFTIFWLIGAINSLNLIDGMDGLLSSVGIIVSLALTLVAAMNGLWIGAVLGAAIGGALVGFLIYNFPPASIFLGNSGSMLIGLFIGVLALEGSLKGPATVALATPIVILTIPIFDSVAAILRRKLTGRSIYTTDRAHLHHVLLGKGFSNRRVLFAISLLCLVTMAGALVSVALKNEFIAIVAAVAVVSILIVTRLFGYAEFLLLKNRLISFATSLFHLRSPGRRRETSVQLQGSGDWRDLWHDLTAMAEHLGLQSICLDVNVPALHEGFHARWANEAELHPEYGATQWRAEIPLAANGDMIGRLEVVGVRQPEAFWQQTADFVRFLEHFERNVASLLRAHNVQLEPAAVHL